MDVVIVGALMGQQEHNPGKAANDKETHKKFMIDVEANSFCQIVRIKSNLMQFSNNVRR